MGIVIKLGLGLINLLLKKKFCIFIVSILTNNQKNKKDN